jgi:hypothetical protein
MQEQLEDKAFTGLNNVIENKVPTQYKEDTNSLAKIFKDNYQKAGFNFKPGKSAPLTEKVGKADEMTKKPSKWSKFKTGFKNFSRKIFGLGKAVAIQGKDNLINLADKWKPGSANLINGVSNMFKKN